MYKGDQTFSYPIPSNYTFISNSNHLHFIPEGRGQVQWADPLLLPPVEGLARLLVQDVAVHQPVVVQELQQQHVNTNVFVVVQELQQQHVNTNA